MWLNCYKAWGEKNDNDIVLMPGEMEPLSPENLYRDYDSPNMSKALGCISPFKPTALAELAYERAYKNA